MHIHRARPQPGVHVCVWPLTRLSTEAWECGIWLSFANISAGARPTAPISCGTNAHMHTHSFILYENIVHIMTEIHTLTYVYWNRSKMHVRLCIRADKKKKKKKHMTHLQSKSLYFKKRKWVLIINSKFKVCWNPSLEHRGIPVCRFTAVPV